MLLNNKKLFELYIVKKLIVATTIELCAKKSVEISKGEIEEFLNKEFDSILQNILNGKS